MEREYQERGDLSVPPMLDTLVVTDRGGEKEKKRKEKKRKKIIKRIKE